jgi:hypothetical protein
MGPGEVLISLFVIGIPSMVFGLLMARWFRLKEKRLEIEALAAAEKAAQYASRSTELEARVRVLEQIVTDQGAQTAAQIEALRQPRVITNGDKVQ